MQMSSRSQVCHKKSKCQCSNPPSSKTRSKWTDHLMILPHRGTWCRLTSFWAESTPNYRAPKRGSWTTALIYHHGPSYITIPWAKWGREKMKNVRSTRTLILGIWQLWDKSYKNINDSKNKPPKQSTTKTSISKRKWRNLNLSLRRTRNLAPRQRKTGNCQSRKSSDFNRIEMINKDSPPSCRERCLRARSRRSMSSN